MRSAVATISDACFEQGVRMTLCFEVPCSVFEPEWTFALYFITVILWLIYFLHALLCNWKNVTGYWVKPLSTAWQVPISHSISIQIAYSIISMCNHGIYFSTFSFLEAFKILSVLHGSWIAENFVIGNFFKFLRCLLNVWYDIETLFIQYIDTLDCCYTCK